MARTYFAKPEIIAALVLLVGLPAAGPASAQQVMWGEMQHMQLEAQYAGPLRDTIIQRLRDPQSGTVCYIYLPITAAHTAVDMNGYVQYGPNTIGTISCFSDILSLQPRPTDGN